MGVREEAALDQRTMEICLAEIARCKQTRIKPNFIILLGDRYGWRPLPSRINKDEFERVLRNIRDDADQELVQGWHQLDENAVPPEYLLRPRDEEYKDFSKWEPLDLTALKEFLRDKLPEENIYPFAPGELNQLCGDAYESLARVIKSEAPDFETRSEQDAHDAFARERSRNFFGRATALQAISGYLQGDERRPLVLHGPGSRRSLREPLRA